MVTLDKIVYNVDTFTGDLAEGRRDYERAKQGLEVIESNESALEEALKESTGFNELNLPHTQEVTEITKGDVTISIISQKRTRKPQYKTAVVGMENYLNGIAFLLEEGRAITGVLREGRSTFISVDRLLESYDVIVAGIMSPEVKHTIRYDVGGTLLEEKVPDKIDFGAVKSPVAFTPENFSNYVWADKIKANIEKYVKSYEKALTKGQKKTEQITAVTSRSAYKSTKCVSEGVDWCYVVSNIVTVPTRPESLGELNVLSDTTISLAEKQRQFPTYRLMYHEVRGEKQVYVSIQSVYDRIQELKGDKSIIGKRTTIEPKEIV
jgi:hypothetical protein